MTKTKRITEILIFGIILSCLSCIKILKADNSMEANYVLEKTEDFNVAYPLDWEKKTKGGILMFAGPVLTEEQNRPKRPVITIKRDTDEDAVRTAEKTKENYNRWEKLPNIKNKMLEFLMKNFSKVYQEGRYEFISSDFEENNDFIMLHIIDIDKERKVKIYSVDFITKGGPIKSYDLMFVCIQEYFDEYLPVFKRCVDSFDINE